MQGYGGGNPAANNPQAMARYQQQRMAAMQRGHAPQHAAQYNSGTPTGAMSKQPMPASQNLSAVGGGFLNKAVVSAASPHPAAPQQRSGAPNPNAANAYSAQQQMAAMYGASNPAAAMAMQQQMAAMQRQQMAAMQGATPQQQQAIMNQMMGQQQQQQAALYGAAHAQAAQAQQANGYNAAMGRGRGDVSRGRGGRGRGRGRGRGIGGAGGRGRGGRGYSGQGMMYPPHGINPMMGNPMAGAPAAMNPMNPMAGGAAAAQGAGGPNASSFEPFADAQGTPCRFYGSEAGCRFGEICHYSHSEPNSVPKCKSFGSPAGCYYADSCHYRHKDYGKDEKPKVCTFAGRAPRGRGRGGGGRGGISGAKLAAMNANAETMDSTVDADTKVEVCKFYDGTEGSCVRGVSCRYRHICAESKEERKEVKGGGDEEKKEREEEMANGGGGVQQGKGKDDTVETMRKAFEGVSIQHDGDGVDEEDEDDMELIE